MQYTARHITTVMARIHYEMVNKHPAPEIHVCPRWKTAKIIWAQSCAFHCSKAVQLFAVTDCIRIPYEYDSGTV